MGKKSTPGNGALILAAVTFGFAIYMLIWSINHRGSDLAAVVVLGGVAVVLLVFGLIRRYQPRSGGHVNPPER